MACFRFRLQRDDGTPYSPEHLADSLAISGDTVRRWESGQAKPSKADLERFSAACSLSTVEKAFLQDAFAVVQTEPGPDSAVFRKVVSEILLEPFPAYVYDSLFHIRAWNSYIDSVHAQPFDPKGGHALSRVFDDPDPRFPASRTLRTREERSEWWLRAFWFQTARLCGSEPYAKVIDTLSQNKRFAQMWLSLGLSTYEDWRVPIGAPAYRVEEGKGSFRISTSSISVPPTYYLREFVPADDVSWHRLQDLKASGPPVVMYAPNLHWSEVL